MIQPWLAERGDFTATHAQSIVEVFSGNGRVGLGFFVDACHVVTCAHVVSVAGLALKIRIPLAERLVRVVYSDQTRDIAILQLDSPVSGFELMPLELESTATVGAQVTFVGWSVVPTPGVERGNVQLHASTIQTVSTANLGSGNMELFELAGDCQPGYSGGPVVLEGEARVCGMVIARDPGQRHAFAIPGQLLCRCYRNYLKEIGTTIMPTHSMVVGKPEMTPLPGGKYNPHHHIARPAIDAQVMAMFDQRVPIVLCAPTMSGKSWWLEHLLNKLTPGLLPKGRVARPMSATFDQSITLEGLLVALINALVRAIGGNAKAARDDWDDGLNPEEASRYCIENHFFKRFDGEALLVLDLPDGFWDNPRQGSFFSLLRAWRTASPPWNRLRLLVAYSTTPSAWTGNPADSPFSVLPVTIEDWNHREVLLAASMHEGLNATERTADRIAALVGGHPYLVRFVLHDAQTKQKSVDDYIAALDHDPEPIVPVVERLFARCRLRDDLALQDAFRSVTSRTPNLDYKSYRKLCDAGLVRGSRAKPTLRATVFARIL